MYDVKLHKLFLRGNKFKIYQDHVQYNLRKYFFSDRVIQIWNSLLDFVIQIT